MKNNQKFSTTIYPTISLKTIQYAELISINTLEQALKRMVSKVFFKRTDHIDTNFGFNKLRNLHVELKRQLYIPGFLKSSCKRNWHCSKQVFSSIFQKDLVVQMALLLFLEPKLEVFVLRHSFGGKQKKNCYRAIKEIQKFWQKCTWVLPFEISKSFDYNNYNLLLLQISSFCDRPTTDLIAKFIHAGYVDILNLVDSVDRAKLKTLYGSLISTTLANFYLNSLDLYISQTLLYTWNFSSLRIILPEYYYRKNLFFDNLRVIWLLVMRLGFDPTVDRKNFQVNLRNQRALENKFNFFENFFRCLFYIRYFEDILICFSGTKKEAKSIYTSVENFLKKKLCLTFNNKKIKIYFVDNRAIRFLGFLISYNNEKEILLDFKTNKKRNSLEQPFYSSYRFNTVGIPVKKVMENAVEKGYAKLRKDNTIRATSYRRLCSLEDKQIVANFLGFIKDFLEYYVLVSRLSEKRSILFLYRKSCSLTIADKHKLKSAATVYKRYGFMLKLISATVFLY